MTLANIYPYRWKLTRFGTMLIVLAAVKITQVDAQTVPLSGGKLFAQQCGACHSVKAGETRVGPSLAGIVGKTAGKQAGFSYSDGLKRSSMKWNPATLDRWLTDSAKAIPGSVMGYKQADAAKRKAIIGYLQAPTGK
ncbi:c-type cytochrome [Sphingobium sp.]|uniref:c-type cytochrome n=1 Tax=Sphingobium sp. TaxID=1912891 RepID=UPI0028BEEF03|nr:c-type cytochrome [Sphingobium sp.]